MQACTAGLPSLNYGHDHIDDLSLWIYGKGGWQLPEHIAYKLHGGGIDVSQNFDSSRWHNVPWIDGQGQLGDNKGATGEGIYCGTPGPSWFWQREASMPLHVSTDHYAFARADGTRLYSPSLNLNSLLRTIGFSRDAGFVSLQDHVSSSTPHTIQQIFHSLYPDGTRVEGPWIRLDNHTDGEPVTMTPVQNTVMGIRMIAPASANATTLPSLTYPCGENICAMDIDGIISIYQYWTNLNSSPFFGYVQVSTGGIPRTQNDLLEVLWLTDANGWNGRPAIYALDPSNPEAGFSIALASGTEKWIYNANGDAPSAGGLSLPGSATGSIGVVRYSGSNVIRFVLQGQGRLVDQDGARVLLDWGVQQGVVLEVSLEGTSAVLSGTATPDGVRFWGTDVTSVAFSRDGVQTPLPFTRDGSIVTVSASNLIQNGDFSQGLDYWAPWDLPRIGASGGEGLISAGDGNARFAQQVTLLPNRQYQFSFRMRTEDVSGYFQAMVNDAFTGESRLPGQPLSYSTWQGYQDYSFAFNSGDSVSVYVYVGNWGGSSGTAYLTSIRLIDITPSP